MINKELDDFCRKLNIRPCDLSRTSQKQPLPLYRAVFSFLMYPAYSQTDLARLFNQAPSTVNRAILRLRDAIYVGDKSVKKIFRNLSINTNNKPMNRPDFNSFSKQVYEANKEKGFHDTAHPDKHYLTLIVSELMEAVEADRKGRRAGLVKFYYYLMGSFTVLPPDTPQGDLPSVTIKIMYSPAIEQGLNDKNFYNRAIDNIISLFKEGYALEEGNSVSDFEKLDLRGDMSIYIHQNDSETINNLLMGVTSGFTSIETAQEHSIYSAEDEPNRLRKQKEQEAQDERDAIARQHAGSAMNNTNIQRKITAR